MKKQEDFKAALRVIVERSRLPEKEKTMLKAQEALGALSPSDRSIFSGIVALFWLSSGPRMPVATFCRAFEKKSEKIDLSAVTGVLSTKFPVFCYPIPEGVKERAHEAFEQLSHEDQTIVAKFMGKLLLADPETKQVVWREYFRAPSRSRKNHACCLAWRE